MADTTIDLMEYSTDALAQAAYATNSTEVVDRQVTGDMYGTVLGDTGGLETRKAQIFRLSKNLCITAVEIKNRQAGAGTPSGNWTLRIETESSSKPSGTLAHANASVVVAPPSINTIIKGTFANPFVLNGSTNYWLVVQCDNQSTDNYWRISSTDVVYTGQAYSFDGGATWTIDPNYELYHKIYTKSLQCYSETTIKTQGTYALKGVAAATDSLNKTLTRTIT